jgi:hypothetical protein
MEQEQFEKMAKTFGGQLKNWPLAQRQEAADYLQDNPDAVNLLGTARSLDGMLDQIKPLAASADLKLKIMNLAQPMEKPVPFMEWFLAQLKVPSVVFAALLVAGFWIGSGPLGLVLQSGHVLDMALVNTVFGSNSLSGGLDEFSF